MGATQGVLRNTSLGDKVYEYIKVKELIRLLEYDKLSHEHPDLFKE